MNNQEVRTLRSTKDFWAASVDIDVLCDKELSISAKFVFSLLCIFATMNNRGVWPGNEKIAKMAGVSIRTVARAYKELRARGVIARWGRFDEEDGAQTSSYTAIIGHNAQCYEENTTPATTAPVQATTPHDTHDTPPMTHMTPKEYHMNIKDSFTREAKLPPSVELQTDPEPLPKSTPETTTTPAPESEPESAPIPVSEHTPESATNSVKNSNQGSVNACVPKAHAESRRKSFSPEDAPDIMRPTARYLLYKTGRKALTEAEISALHDLSKTQYPARIQKEIDRACERFQRRGNNLETLTFCYIAGALCHQPTYDKKTRKKSKPNPMSLTQAQIDAAQEHLTEEELDRDIALLKAEMHIGGC